MLRELKYAALSGKTRAMFGKLLRFEDYRTLMQKKSVSEVVSYLKHETHYQHILSNTDEMEMHRGQLENLLRQDLINDYQKLLNFTSGNIHTFIDQLHKKAEVESLKFVFRLFEAGRADQLAVERITSGIDKVDLSKLALSRNMEEFLAGLKGTVYYDILRPFTGENNEIRLFNMEMALDLYYLRNLQNCFNSLMDSEDCAIIRELIGLESDIFNIFWIYRSKNFYNIDTEVIRSYTLPLIYKLRKSTMDSLIKAKNLTEFVDILKRTPYGFLFEGQNQLLAEHNYAEFIYRVYRKRFRNEPFTIASVIAFIRMKEMELSNIISIVEGIRYRLPEDKIQKFVTGMNF